MSANVPAVTDIKLPVGQVVAELAQLGIVGFEVKAFGRRPNFDEAEHPRDMTGQFVEVGGTVRLRAGGTAEVLDVVGGGRIRVRRDDDGREVVIDSGLVTQVASADERGGGGTVTDDDGEVTRVGQPSLATDTVVPPGPGGGSAPMTDEEFAARAAYVEDKVGAARKAKLATEFQFSMDGKGKVWTRERSAMHDEIIAEVMATATNVPNQGKAVFSGGMGGSGKTFTLGRPETGLDQSQYLTLNPDDIKEIMAARGMVPDVPDAPDLSPMERAALIHEESSHITQLIAHQAYAQRKNIIWDITMASADSVQKRVTSLHQARYVETKAVFVDISVEGSVARAMGRYRGGQDKFQAGEEGALGGRYVPPFVIRESASTSFSSANRANFEQLKEQFDDWQVWDNSVDKRLPRLVYEKSSPNLAELVAAARDGLTDADRLELKSMPGTRAALFLTLRRKGLGHLGQRQTGGLHP